MKKLIYTLLLAAFTFSSCLDKPDLFPDSNVGNFEALWKIIDTKYCYLDYKNINWDSIHSVYSQQIDSSMNKYEFFDLMGNMLAELKDGHVNLYSNFDVSRYHKWFTDYPSNFSTTLLYSNRYLGNNYRISGGMRYNLIADKTIGYIYYGDFSNSFSDVNVRNIFDYFRECQGLIIDVRNNGGGYLNLSEELASHFFERDTVTGFMSYKTGDGHSDFSTPDKVKTKAHKTIQWQRPVIILTNRMSFSATNSFVCRMKMAPKATIVGDKTGGGGGLPISSEIPNGWMVRFSASPMFDADMNHTEWGIDPDIKIDLDSTDMEKGFDTIIEKAIKLIKE